MEHLNATWTLEDCEAVASREKSQQFFDRLLISKVSLFSNLKTWEETRFDNVVFIVII